MQNGSVADSFSSGRIWRIQQRLHFLLALSPDGRKLYIPFWNQVPGKMTWEDGFLQQLDVPTLTPGPNLKVGHFPLNLSIAPDGKTAVVDTTADGAVAVVDLSQLKIVRIIKTDEWPHGIAIF
jgi:DNA-binding beta-propeller fold protein YncE